MSGWTAITIKMEAGETPGKLKAELEEEVDFDEYDDVRTTAGKVEVRLAGYDRDEHLVLDKLDLEKVDKVAVIMANDTTDGGDGDVYEVEAGELNYMTSIRGYESARARDVAGEIDQYYGFYPSTGYR